MAQKTKGTKILTICVHYNNLTDVVSYLNNIFHQTNYLGHVVIVVDNSLNIGNGLSKFREYIRSDRLVVYEPNKNLGYYGAASFALSRYTQIHSFPDWVIVSNTDVVIINRDFFEILIKKHNSCKKAAVVSPHIQSDSSPVEWISYQKERSSLRNIKIKKFVYNIYPLLILYDFYTYVRWLFRHKFLSVFYISKENAKHLKEKEFIVYAPAGAYTIFKKSYFLAGGTLNLGTFLYGEEVFVAETARRLGVDIYHDPSLKIVHKGYATTNIFSSPQILKYKKDAMNYIYSDFFSDESKNNKEGRIA